MNSADDVLRALTDRGFRYVTAPGYSLGAAWIPYTLLYVFGWDAPYIDVLHLRAESDVTGVRSCSADANLFAPDAVVWKAEGGLIEVAADLLALPAPGEPGAPSRTIRAPSRLWTPARALPGQPTPTGPFAFL